MLFTSAASVGTSRSTCELLFWMTAPRSVFTSLSCFVPQEICRRRGECGYGGVRSRSTDVVEVGERVAGGKDKVRYLFCNSWTRMTHICRMFMYVGERSIYGTKLVSICHGSNDSTLDTAYTERLPTCQRPQKV